MCRECDRLKTFEKWPIEYINPKDLATAGFYYYPINSERLKTSINTQVKLMLLPRQGFSKESTVLNDRVWCFSCGMEIGYWKHGDEPFTERKKWSPVCHFVRLVDRICNK